MTSCIGTNHFITWGETGSVSATIDCRQRDLQHDAKEVTHVFDGHVGPSKAIARVPTQFWFHMLPKMIIAVDF